MKTIRLQSLLAVLAATFLAASHAAAEVATYTIDPVHSGVGFKIRHHFTKVPGNFAEFSGTIHFDAENPSASSVEATIAAASVDTNSDKRDGHLRSDDFFKVATYPEITFKSTSWKKVGENQFEVVGDLTMVGQTHPVTLAVEFLGEGPGNRDTVISGWDISGSLDRTDWGITYGPGIVGNEVAIEISVEAKKS